MVTKVPVWRIFARSRGVKIPRDIASAALVKCLCKHWGYSFKSQSGSHIKLETVEPSRSCITIPAHDRLLVGTLKAILKAVANHKGARVHEILVTLGS